MLLKFISLTISYSLLLFVNHSYKPAYAADCETHLSRPGANKAKKLFRKKKAMKKLENLEELIQEKGN